MPRTAKTLHLVLLLCCALGAPACRVVGKGYTVEANAASEFERAVRGVGQVLVLPLAVSDLEGARNEDVRRLAERLTDQLESACKRVGLVVLAGAEAQAEREEVLADLTMRTELYDPNEAAAIGRRAAADVVIYGELGMTLRPDEDEHSRNRDGIKWRTRVEGEAVLVLRAIDVRSGGFLHAPPATEVEARSDWKVHARQRSDAPVPASEPRVFEDLVDRLGEKLRGKLDLHVEGHGSRHPTRLYRGESAVELLGIGDRFSFETHPALLEGAKRLADGRPDLALDSFAAARTELEQQGAAATLRARAAHDLALAHLALAGRFQAADDQETAVGHVRSALEHLQLAIELAGLSSSRELLERFRTSVAAPPGSPTP